MRYRAPANLGYLTIDDSVYAMVLPAGEPCVLEGTAAIIWSAAAAGEDAVAKITAAFDEPGVADHTRQFLDELVGLGLLEVAP